MISIKNKFINLQILFSFQALVSYKKKNQEKELTRTYQFNIFFFFLCKEFIHWEFCKSKIDRDHLILKKYKHDLSCDYLLYSLVCRCLPLPACRWRSINRCRFQRVKRIILWWRYSSFEAEPVWVNWVIQPAAKKTYGFIFSSIRRYRICNTHTSEI